MLVSVQRILLGFALVAEVWCHTTSTNCLSPVTVTLQSKLNKTGQWTATVGLEHLRKSSPWVVKTDICEDGETVRITSTISAEGDGFGGGVITRVVPPDYIHFPGIGYYRFYPNGTDWPTARLRCSEEGAHLAIINSEEEADVMTLLFARYPKGTIAAGDNSEWAWIGAHEMGVDGAFYTIYGKPLSTTGFTRWVSGQGNDKGVDDGVVTNRRSGGLGDAFPNWIAPYICEL